MVKYFSSILHECAVEEYLGILGDSENCRIYNKAFKKCILAYTENK